MKLKIVERVLAKVILSSGPVHKEYLGHGFVDC